MAPTPNFLFGSGPEDTSAHAIASDLSDARVRRQAASGERRRQAASRGGGGVPPRKTPQRGLGVAELERLRCGGWAPPRKTPQRGLSMSELERPRCGSVDPLQYPNVAAMAAMLEAATANLQAQGNSVVVQQTMMGLADRRTRPPSAANATNASYYSIHYVAATITMIAARKETAGEGFSVAPEGRKEVREIEFFPTGVSSHGGGPDESELRRTRPLSSSPPGGVGGSLDLSLRL
ncbi:hypothetical protein CFC21_003294 [Triticum aestivum]|uniref:Uncharacterized protein n=1 Tax=Triticum aestivum TaxID=4565 RepID=A0A3B5Y471_WHEAT|nr:hypothetical protein CFC21_003294 [Triticum aestivum]